ncbi:hypothetical protein GQR58_019633 [Nymphon striatum]|nr:hypothetical protein GQR58_019633 [Nymphon striatum]
MPKPKTNYVGLIPSISCFNSQFQVSTVKILLPPQRERVSIKLSNNLKKVSSSSSVTYLIQHHAETTFFPNVRELLSILAVLPLGSCEAERNVPRAKTSVAKWAGDKPAGAQMAVPNRPILSGKCAFSVLNGVISGCSSSY